jgi:lysozyme family protein
VTQRTYDEWLAPAPSRDVWQITMPEVEVIYYQRYWVPIGAGFRDYPLNLFLFDAAVNHGHSRARKFLASSQGDPIRYLDARVAFYHAIVRHRPTQRKFLRGWLNRADTLRRLALPTISSLEELQRRAAA